MLRERRNHGADGSTPPPCTKQGVKNDHSPWSAPRERKRRPKPAEVALSSIEEIEYTTSPPKRHNGGSSPAARELALQAPLGSPFAVERPAAAAAADVGPLAQGLLANGPFAAPAGDLHFSPLASGLVAAGFATELQQPPHQGGEKQRKHLRHAAAFRAAIARQQSGVDVRAGPGRAGVPGPVADMQAGPQAAQACWLRSCELPPQAAQGLGSALWQPLAWTAVGQPACLAAQQQQQQQQLALAGIPSFAQQQSSHAAFPLDPALAFQDGPRRQSGAGALLAVGPGGSPVRRSAGHEMDTDLRASWGSDRSADVSGWRSLQARMRRAAELDASPVPAAGLDSLESSPGDLPPLGGLLPAPAVAAGLRRQSSLADDPMRSSADGALSTRSSLDGPSCSERQASLVPLRSAGARSHAWQSHQPSPPADARDGTSPDPLLGVRATGGGGRRRATSALKMSCFSCSPFLCRQRGGGAVADESDEEVVRRNDSEEFVIRRQPSIPSPATSRGTSGRPKHTTLNRPPPGEAADVMGRQLGFSACRAPGTSSPASCAGSEDSVSLASGPGMRGRGVGLRDASLQELYAGSGDGDSGAAVPPTETVDALNDMLRALSLCPTAHPKDAEELVTKVCQDHSFQPNATTARTLEKMWAVHEQLYG